MALDLPEEAVRFANLEKDVDYIKKDLSEIKGMISMVLDTKADKTWVRDADRKLNDLQNWKAERANTPVELAHLASDIRDEKIRREVFEKEVMKKFAELDSFNVRQSTIGIVIVSAIGLISSILGVFGKNLGIF